MYEKTGLDDRRRIKAARMPPLDGASSCTSPWDCRSYGRNQQGVHLRRVPAYLPRNTQDKERVVMSESHVFHIVRGKTVRQWAAEFGVSIPAVYVWLYNGTLESRIDGTFVSPERKPYPSRVHFGKTVSEWAVELKCSIPHVRLLVKEGRLEDVASGKSPVYRRRLVMGQTLRHWADLLGISRERARQLADDGKLIPRIKGEVIPRKPYNGKRMKAVASQNYRVETRVTCKDCKHFLNIGNAGRCELGNFCLFTKYGICDKHEEGNGNV